MYTLKYYLFKSSIDSRSRYASVPEQFLNTHYYYRYVPILVLYYYILVQRQRWKLSLSLSRPQLFNKHHYAYFITYYVYTLYNMFHLNNDILLY